MKSTLFIIVQRKMFHKLVRSCYQKLFTRINPWLVLQMVGHSDKSVVGFANGLINQIISHYFAVTWESQVPKKILDSLSEKEQKRQRVIFGELRTYLYC